MKYEYKCGCKFDKLDFDKINLDCPATWDLINSGYTRGIFQLEGSLGKRYSKELKPRNIDELSDLISLIRPGCLEAPFREDQEKPGKFWSITSTYQKVKDKVIEPEYIHPILKPIFEQTYSVPVYQEQMMRICADFAGLDLQTSDKIRKACGKKKPELMKKMGDIFTKSAINNGHSKELIKTVFSWIEKFSGYNFNKSHGVSYAMIGYQTAYAKRHMPLLFFKAMLTHSEDKQDTLDEIQALVHEAKLFDITVKPPCVKLANPDFDIQNKKTIAFGLGHIKGVGKSSLKSIINISNTNNTNELLKRCFTKGKSKVKSNVMEALIKSGAFDYLNKDRLNLIVKYKILKGLTERERKEVFETFLPQSVDLLDAFGALLLSSVPRGKDRKEKVKLLINKTKRHLQGNVKKTCIAYEKYYLGIPLSGSLVELYSNPYVSIKCRNFQRLSEGAEGAMGVVIEKVRVIKDKNHNEMCFMTVSDDTYLLDSVVVFSSIYKYQSWIIEEGKPVLLIGKKNRGSFLVRKIEHL